MTTDNTQPCGHKGVNWNGEGDCITCARDKVLGDSLDEIIGTHMGSGEIFPRMSKKEAKQAILNWHNKQIEEVLDRLVKKQVTPAEYIYPVVSVHSIEAERNKLKN